MDPMTATRDDVDREVRRARQRLNGLLRDATYLDSLNPMDLLSIGRAAEELADAVEEAERRREVDKLHWAPVAFIEGGGRDG
jgi:hypothetical protein